MNPVSEQTYFRQRATTSRRNAATARGACATIAHMALADAYDLRAIAAGLPVAPRTPVPAFTWSGAIAA